MKQHELAKLCGCAPSTVSKALRGSAGINPDTRQRILEAAEANGITISTEQLIRGRTVLVCAPTFNNERTARMLSRLRIAFSEMGISVVASSWEYDSKLFAGLPHIARSISNLCGILIFSIGFKEQTSMLTELDVPVIFGISCDDCDCIPTDYSVGYRAAVRHLLTKGRRRIAFIGERLTTSKEQSFRQAMLDCGRAADERLIYRSATYSTRAGAEGFTALMRLPEPPDAIVCGYDYIALGVLNCAEAAGITVPDELAVIGADDIKAASAYRLGLTTLAVNQSKKAEAFIGLLLRRIKNPDAPPQKITMPLELIVRGTA